MPHGEILLKSTDDYQACVNTLTSKYFKHGKSKHGKLSFMDAELGNSNNTVIPNENFNLLEYYKECLPTKRKIYLMTKKKTPSLYTDSSSDELPDPSDKIVTQSPITPTSTYSVSTDLDVCLQTLKPLPMIQTQACMTPTNGPSTSQFVVHADTPTISMALPDRNCGICAERERDAFFIPCGHTICLVCGLQIENMGQTCPNCRSQIHSVKSMFYN